MRPVALAPLLAIAVFAAQAACGVALADDAKPAAPSPVAAPATPTPVAAPATPAPSVAATKPVYRPAVPAAPPLPLEMTIVAASPDPPWTLRIVNVGDHPVRIAADQRLLTFELEVAGKHGKIKCAAPAGLTPRKFPSDRELYLEPGQAFVEDFDPRLFCFGDRIDLLRGGTVVRAHLGWSKTQSTKGPFVAEGIDKPAAFTPQRELSAPPIMLSYASFAPMPLHLGEDPADAPDGPHPPKSKSDGKPPRSASAPSGDKERDEDRERDKTNAKSTPAAGSPGKTPDAAAPASDEKPDYADRNAARLDVYTERYSDASAPRDAVIRIKAANDSRRELIAAIRGHMLSFLVEELGADNEPVRSIDCIGSERPHAISVEAIQDLEGGQAVSVPLLIAEICPTDAFERPGLYRVRPRIDTSVEGEALERHAYIGKALALQPALVRVATSKKPFQDDKPHPFGMHGAEEVGGKTTPTSGDTPSAPRTRDTPGRDTAKRGPRAPGSPSAGAPSHGAPSPSGMGVSGSGR